jgi:hypothetical protein
MKTPTPRRVEDTRGPWVDRPDAWTREHHQARRRTRRWSFQLPVVAWARPQLEFRRVHCIGPAMDQVIGLRLPHSPMPAATSRRPSQYRYRDSKRDGPTAQSPCQSQIRLVFSDSAEVTTSWSAVECRRRATGMAREWREEEGAKGLMIELRGGVRFLQSLGRRSAGLAPRQSTRSAARR